MISIASCMMLGLAAASLVLAPAHADRIPDYENPFAPISTDKPSYTWTDKVRMTIIAPSWNTNRHLVDSIGDGHHPITISSAGNSLGPYRFTETGPNSGTFAAELVLTGFLHDADGDGDHDTSPWTGGAGPNGGFLEADRDGAITISFEFADGVIVSESVPVTWNVGTVGFSRERFAPDDAVEVTVADPDMNLNPDLPDRVRLHILSDSDAAGIIVDAIETSGDSGTFAASVSLTGDSVSSGSRLHSAPGDRILARYDDYTLPEPHPVSDVLTLEAAAEVDSGVPAHERIRNLGARVDGHTGKPAAGNLVRIVGTVANMQDFVQDFVYLFQVRGPGGHAESLSWIRGQLHPGQQTDVSQSWVPAAAGNHTVETFVWDSLADPTALGSAASVTVGVDAAGPGVHGPGSGGSPSTGRK